MKKNTLPLFALLLISGCASNEIGHSKDVNQDEIHQGYSLSYDEAKNETRLLAYFRFAGPNGTTLFLDEPSKLTLNGETVANIQDGTGSYYSKTFTGPPVEKEYDLVFTDINGKKFENKIDFRGMQVEELPKEISKTEAFTIRFMGKPERRNEDLSVEISDDSTTVSETWKNVLFERVKFPKEKLDRLHGKVKINIHRNGWFEPAQQTHAKGFITTEYELIAREAILKD